MSTVDIAKGWRKYSKENLIKFAQSGILVCNGYEIDEFLQYLLEGIEEELYQKAFDAGYAVGWEQGRYYGELEGGD